ncbi:hypothetical protein ACFOSO_24785, partial [Planomonospora venezuelensis]
MTQTSPAAVRVPGSHRAGRSRAWLVFLLLGGLVAVAVPFAAGLSPVVDVLAWVLLPGAAAVAVVTGMRRRRTASRAWRLICAGLLITLVATIAGWGIGWTWLGSPLLLAAYQLSTLAAYGLSLIALVLLSLRATGSRGAALLDAGIITVGVAMPLWAFFIDPIIHRDPDIGPDLAFALALPVIDLFIVGLVVRMALDHGRAPWLRLLSASYVAMFFSDVVYLLNQASDQLYGAISTACWLAWSVLVGSAMLHPSVAFVRRRPSAAGGRVRGTMLLALALLSPLVSVLGQLLIHADLTPHPHNGIVVTALTVLLAVL